MNDFEKRCHDTLRRQGFEVLRNGWPDFLVLTPDWKRGFALELKRRHDSLRPEQERMHSALARFGVLTHVVRDDFQKVLGAAGHKLLFPTDVGKLSDSLRKQLNEVARMREQVEQMTQRIEGEIAGVQAALTLFERVNPDHERLKGESFCRDIDSALIAKEIRIPAELVR